MTNGKQLATKTLQSVHLVLRAQLGAELQHRDCAQQLAAAAQQLTPHGQAS